MGAMRGRLPGRLLSALALVSVATPGASAAVPFFGGPTYTVGVGGFKDATVPFGLQGPSIGDAASGIGYANKYDAANVNKGARPFRMESNGAVVELGILGTSVTGVTDAKANAVNDSGVAAGFVRKYDGSGNTLGDRAIRWEASGTAATELAILGADANGITDAFAYSINAAGVIVGAATKYEAGVFKGGWAVRWDAGGTAITELDNLGLNTSGNTGSSAFAINNAGTIVGEAAKWDGSSYRGTRAARWAAGGTAIEELGNAGTDASGFTTSQAYAVNASGTAIGYAQKYVGGSDKGERGVRWNAGGTAASELGILGTSATGFSRSHAYDINEAGTAIGYAQKYDGSMTMQGVRAVRWEASSTVPIELGNLGLSTSGFANTQAFDINELGLTAGSATAYDGLGNPLGTKAVVWDINGIPLDLNTLIDPGSGWALQSAKGISDTGWVIGEGRFDPDGAGAQVAYGRMFLMQVPEPSGVSLLLAGGVALARRGRRASVAA